MSTPHTNSPQTPGTGSSEEGREGVGRESQLQTQTQDPSSSPASPLICIQTSSGVVFLWDLICSPCLFLRNAGMVRNKLKPVAVITHCGTGQLCGCLIYSETRDFVFPLLSLFVALFFPGRRFISDTSIPPPPPPLLSLIRNYDPSFCSVMSTARQLRYNAVLFQIEVLKCSLIVEPRTELIKFQNISSYIPPLSVKVGE